jgi:hypothetical protein
MKRVLSAVLAWLLCCGVIIIPAGAASAGFTDISDPAVAEAAETLRTLGIVQGMEGGSFQPDGTFTRAAFCKMAILAEKRGGEAGLQKGRVIFSDVTAQHWALGYVNAAASGTSPLVRGSGDGSFRPEDAVTYGQAVAILMRMLGYTDSDVSTGGLWYNGYLTMADSIGLTKRVTAAGEDVVTRGQAAILFENLLFTKPKGGSSVFLVATLGCTVVSDAVLLSVTNTTVKTADKSYKTDHTGLSSLKGYTVNLYLNTAGKVVAARSDDTSSGSNQTYTLNQFERTYIKTADGTSVTVSPSTEFWKSGVKTTYGEAYLNLTAGATITCYFDGDGTVERMILVNDGSSVKAGFITAVTTTNPFASLTGTDTFTVTKNGGTASLSDLRAYDVGSYNQDTQVLVVSDRKVTGIFEGASPSLKDPSTVTVMGHAFSVLSCAVDSVSSYKVGDAVTLLLDSNNKVAGMVSADKVSVKSVGVVTAVSNPTITVTLTTGVTVTGTTPGGDSFFEYAQGKLAMVSSSKKGTLDLSLIADRGVAFIGGWDVKKGTLGQYAISPAVSVYERVGNSKLYDVGLDQVTVGTVTADKINYVGTDYAGRVNLIILENVTGDCYSYGLLDFISAADSGLMNSTVTVKQGGTTALSKFITGYDLSKKNGKPVGIVENLFSTDGYNRLGDIVELTAIKNVRRSAFQEKTVTIGGVVYPIADNVCCYNADSKTFFSSLDAARAYSETLTVYYDKPVSDGGKIRMVVAGTLDS